MGKLLKDAHVKVALVGIPQDIADRLARRLAARAEDDAGRVEVTPVKDLAACREGIDAGRIKAVCLAFRGFTSTELVAFIGDIRISHPLVPFCLVGTQVDLDILPGLPQGWRQRLSHYYKFPQDLKEEEFEDNAGLLRDLFVADAVKTRALGQYDTTPGGVIRIKHAAPYGFWISAIITLMAAVLGALLGPVLGLYFPGLKK